MQKGKLMRSIPLAACLLLLTSFAFAQEDSAKLPKEPIIIVTGHGEVDIQPDQAVVRLGATADDKNAADAQQKVSEIVQKSLDAVTALGVKKEKIHTDRISLQPQYESADSSFRHKPKIVGYEASNVLQITLDDLDKIGPVIDAGVTAGANNIEGVDFQLKNDTGASEEALEQATRQAGAKAQAIAHALGADLGSAVKVQENGVQRIMPMAMGRVMNFAAAPAQPTPVEPGQIKITADVTVTYKLKE